MHKLSSTPAAPVCRTERLSFKHSLALSHHRPTKHTSCSGSKHIHTYTIPSARGITRRNTSDAPPHSHAPSPASRHAHNSDSLTNLLNATPNPSLTISFIRTPLPRRDRLLLQQRHPSPQSPRLPQYAPPIIHPHGSHLLRHISSTYPRRERRWSANCRCVCKAWWRGGGVRDVGWCEHRHDRQRE